MVHQLLSLLYRYCSTLLQDAEARAACMRACSTGCACQARVSPDQLGTRPAQHAPHSLALLPDSSRGTAQAYYDSAGRPGAAIDTEDVALAIQAREAFSFTGPPPKHVRPPHEQPGLVMLNFHVVQWPALGPGDTAAGMRPVLQCSEQTARAQVMLELAEQINSRPLPAVSQRAGLLVPQDEDALLAQNLRLRVRDARLSDADVSVRAPAGAPAPGAAREGRSAAAGLACRLLRGLAEGCW